ncbi:MAG TPA: CARDB domain-containing protein [Candidatus Eremiobacteraceae bacterium]|nr:CARDB domain-containing protein [Candidatus Eremiobacteraceae bacterium]
MLGRHGLLVIGAVLAIGSAALPTAGSANTPPPVYQLTFKKIDLTIGGVKYSPLLPCKNGVPGLRFLVTVDNIGRLDLSAVPFNQALTVKGPSHSVMADLPFIAAGGSGKVLVNYYPQTPESAHYPNSTFTFIVNKNRVISESNYDNNTYTTKVALTEPPCGPSASAMPPPATPAAAPSGH